MQLSVLIRETVSGLGCELVDFEMTQLGLLRVFIDRSRGVQIRDCELVSCQLQHVLLVEGFDYERLEVSSPGVDRPLKNLEDFVRFAGKKASIRFYDPVNGKRQFVGFIDSAVDGELTLKVLDGNGNCEVLKFRLPEVKEAHLVPELDFGGRMR